jgi:hypothetical protein
MAKATVLNLSTVAKDMSCKISYVNSSMSPLTINFAVLCMPIEITAFIFKAPFGLAFFNFLFS